MRVLTIPEAVTCAEQSVATLSIFCTKLLVCAPSVDAARSVVCRVVNSLRRQSLSRLDHTQYFSVILSKNIFLFFFTDLRSDDFCKLCSH